MIGPPSVPIKEIVLSLNFSELYKILISAETIYRVPDTLLRFSVFIFSLIFFISIPLVKSMNYQEPKYYSSIISFLSLSFLVTILISDNIYNYIAILLVIFSLIYVILYSRNTLNNIEISLLFTYLLMFTVPFWSSLFHSTSFSEIDNYLRFILVIPIYLTLREIKIAPDKVYLSINMSSILIGLFAIYCALFSEDIRVRGFTSSAMIFGNISLLFSLFSFITISQYLQENKNMIFPIIASLLAFFAWILSGSRGSIFLIFFFIALLFSKTSKENKLYSKKIIATSLIIISIIFINSSTFTRFTNAYESTYNYIFDNSEHYWQHSDSIVPRINLWKGASLLIEKHYAQGIGLNNFNKYLEKEIQLKNIQPIRNFSNNPTAGMNHAHNQYLDIFVKTGILGFMSLLIFIFFVIANFYLFSYFLFLSWIFEINNR